MIPENSSQLASLQKQVYALMIALILLSGTLVYFFYGQVRTGHRAIAQASLIVKQWEDNQALINNFVTQLVAYGETHPEFRPVLGKYGIAPVPGVPANSPVTARPPAAPVAPKK